MQVHSVERDKTFFKNNLLHDYYNGAAYLNPFYSYPPQLDSLIDVMADRNYPEEFRPILRDVLMRQYKRSGIVWENEDKVYKNIQSLSETNTYTITTGQQIHIGLGPLYVWYKIKDVLAICEQAKEKYPDKKFVPVFWMASEDHDFDEINHIPLFGKKYEWSIESNGPVGRLDTSDLSELFKTWFKELRLNQDQQDFIDLCVEAYKESNLADATRKILHRLLKDEGLVILDADEAELKQLFKPVFEDELQGKNFGSLFKTAEQLNEVGVGAQVVVRECNLFYITDNTRVRLKLSENKVSTVDGVELCKRAEIKRFTEENSERLSPNALLRPLYQEWILPNLVYVGGPSEVKYWLQLKALFRNYNLELPIVSARTSNILFPERIAFKQPIETEDFFQKDDAILKQLDKQYTELKDEFQQAFNGINNSIEAYNQLFKTTFPGYNLDGKIKKIEPKILGLKEVVDGNLKVLANQDENLNKVLKTKNRFFHSNQIQERNEHILSWISDLLMLQGELNSVFGFQSSQKINVINT
jgi:bacillithiol biosynthesis cysteine-adding enzyme BshC